MALLAMLALTIAWFAVAEVTGWEMAYAIALAHAGIVCSGVESMI